MLKGFWKLTWVETKVFMREPMGLVGSSAFRWSCSFFSDGCSISAGRRSSPRQAAPFNVAILAALFIALGSVQSLVAIIAIYREGGILKRLRATPLSPVTILGAQVVVKLAFTAVSLALLVLAGKRLFPGAMHGERAQLRRWRCCSAR